jgi:hypothetical protein
MNKNLVILLMVLMFISGLSFGRGIQKICKYRYNEVVKVPFYDKLGIVKDYDTAKLYTIILIDGDGNTLNEIKEIENNIKSFRIGE